MWRGKKGEKKQKMQPNGNGHKVMREQQKSECMSSKGRSPYWWARRTWRGMQDGSKQQSLGINVVFRMGKLALTSYGLHGSLTTH